MTGFAFAVYSTAVAAWVLTVAPHRQELASSGTSIAVNVGIAAGALIGGLALTHTGPASVPAAAAIVTALGVALVLWDAARA